jgi:hypothetical protein
MRWRETLSLLFLLGCCPAEGPDQHQCCRKTTPLRHDNSSGPSIATMHYCGSSVFSCGGTKCVSWIVGGELTSGPVTCGSSSWRRVASAVVALDAIRRKVRISTNVVAKRRPCAMTTAQARRALLRQFKLWLLWW